MDTVKVSIWKDSRGFCMQISDEDSVYVYGTMRSMLNAAEKAFKEIENPAEVG
jgi:hypothetical protein